MIKKDLEKLIREYRQHGWTISKTRSSHYVWRAPNGRRVITASTPGDHHTLANIKSDLRRIAR